MKCKTCGDMNCMEHGGEVEKKPLPKLNRSIKAETKETSDGEPMDDKPEEDDADEELNHMVAEELMDALDRKDKKGVHESIKAIVMNCGGKV